MEARRSEAGARAPWYVSRCLPGRGDNPDLMANFREAEEVGCAFAFYEYPPE